MALPNRKTIRIPIDRRSERGSVIALSAIAMMAMLLATGLAVDIGHLYTAKAELQNAADAAALAAAAQLSSTSGGIKQAVTEATKALNKYDFKNDVTLTSANVTFATNLNGAYVDAATAQANPATIRFVKVTIPPKPVNVTFASLVIDRTQYLTATATAGMSVGLSMNKFYTAFTFIESNASPIEKGKVYTLNSKAWNDTSPNSYRVLAGPDGDLVLTGTVHAYAYIGSTYKVAQLSSADMCRYARIGINTRFGDYSAHPNSNANEHPPDTITSENITYAQYRTMQGDGVVQRNDGMKNRRIITLPIANNSTYNTSTRDVTANRIAAFFIRKKISSSTCTLEVEYIGAPMAVPVGTYQPGGTQMNELSVPVLYK
jgi:Flp pilus assembly protein TadG